MSTVETSGPRIDADRGTFNAPAGFQSIRVVPYQADFANLAASIAKLPP
jgi:hypothetical protein